MDYHQSHLLNSCQFGSVHQTGGHVRLDFQRCLRVDVSLWLTHLRYLVNSVLASIILLGYVESCRPWLLPWWYQWDLVEWWRTGSGWNRPSYTPPLPPTSSPPAPRSSQLTSTPPMNSPTEIHAALPEIDTESDSETETEETDVSRERPETFRAEGCRALIPSPSPTRTTFQPGSQSLPWLFTSYMPGSRCEIPMNVSSAIRAELFRTAHSWIPSRAYDAFEGPSSTRCVKQPHHIRVAC